MKGPQIESDMPSALGQVTRQVDGNKRTDMHYDYDQHVHSNSKGRQVVDCIYCRVTTQTTKSRAALLSYDLALLWTSRKWRKNLFTKHNTLESRLQFRYWRRKRSQTWIAAVVQGHLTAPCKGLFRTPQQRWAAWQVPGWAVNIIFLKPTAG